MLNKQYKIYILFIFYHICVNWFTSSSLKPQFILLIKILEIIIIKKKNEITILYICNINI